MGVSKLTRLLQDSLGGNRSGPPGGSSWGWDRGGMWDSKLTRLLQDSLGGNRSGPPGGSSGRGIGEGCGTPS